MPNLEMERSGRPAGGSLASPARMRQLVRSTVVVACFIAIALATATDAVADGGRKGVGRHIKSSFVDCPQEEGGAGTGPCVPVGSRMGVTVFDAHSVTGGMQLLQIIQQTSYEGSSGSYVHVAGYIVSDRHEMHGNSLKKRLRPYFYITEPGDTPGATDQGWLGTKHSIGSQTTVTVRLALAFDSACKLAQQLGTSPTYCATTVPRDGWWWKAEWGPDGKWDVEYRANRPPNEQGPWPPKELKANLSGAPVVQELRHGFYSHDAAYGNKALGRYLDHYWINQPRQNEAGHSYGQPIWPNSWVHYHKWGSDAIEEPDESIVDLYKCTAWYDTVSDPSCAGFYDESVPGDTIWYACMGNVDGSKCEPSEPTSSSSEITVVSWIDPALINFDTTGVSPGLINDLNSPIGCPLLVGKWFVGQPDYLWPDTPSNNRLPNRKYASAFLIKHGDPTPPDSIGQDYVDNPQKWRQLNQFQVELRYVAGSTIAYPVTAHAKVGTTHWPCQWAGLVGTIIAGRVQGRAHDDNGKIAMTSDGIALLNESRINVEGWPIDVTVHKCDYNSSSGDCDNLTDPLRLLFISKYTPFIWSVIRFNRFTGELEPAGDSSNFDVSFFNTFWVYEDRDILPGGKHVQGDPWDFANRQSDHQRKLQEIP